MKTKLRKFLRQSDSFSLLLSFLCTLPFSNTLKLKFAFTFLQSDGARHKQDKVLKLTIDLLSNFSLSETAAIGKSAMIKAPVIETGQLKEKGLIIIGFEHELDKLAKFKKLDAVTQQYDILFMPTWQPFYSKELLRFLSKAPKSLIILPSSQQCYYNGLFNEKIERILPFHASSWVNGELFKPKPKDIDILMVANFSIYKRHYILFEALQHLPSNLNVVLIGRPLGERTLDVLMQEAKQYGVESRFSVIEGPENEVVIDNLCRAKLVLGLSGREGSYVSLAEALFADCAVGIYQDAVVGTKNYVNPSTGFLLAPGIPLHTQISKCLRLVDSLSPRTWAMSNIDSKANVAKLNKLLKYENNQRGIDWQKDCQEFYIQSFNFYPTSGKWNNDLAKSLQDLADIGLTFKHQSL